MNEPDKWSIADLHNLIESQASESVTLEFKASCALEKTEGSRKELTKDISALANSAGGVIVYGIVEHQETHVAKKLDAGVNLKKIPREFIDQVANGGIHAKVDGLRVRVIDTEGLTEDDHKYFVVVVPESHTAHMAQNHCYYKRWGTEVRPMEDYEVRDVMARSTAPRLKVEINSTPVWGVPHAVDVELWLGNEAVTPAEWCVVQLVVPKPLTIVDNGGAQGVEQVMSTASAPVTVLRFDYGGINIRPIWQGLRVAVCPAGHFPVRIAAPDPGNYLLGWRTTAPRMDWQSGEERIVFP